MAVGIIDVRAWVPMTSMIGEAEVLKTDTGGRVRVFPERWEALLDEFEKSGMSGAKFAGSWAFIARPRGGTRGSWRQSVPLRPPALRRRWSQSVPFRPPALRDVEAVAIPLPG